MGHGEEVSPECQGNQVAHDVPQLHLTPSLRGWGHQTCSMTGDMLLLRAPESLLLEDLGASSSHLVSIPSGAWDGGQVGVWFPSLTPWKPGAAFPPCGAGS